MYANVSIHAPAGGATEAMANDIKPIWFQSTRLREARQPIVKGTYKLAYFMVCR